MKTFKQGYIITICLLALTLFSTCKLDNDVKSLEQQALVKIQSLGGGGKLVRTDLRRGKDLGSEFKIRFKGCSIIKA